MRKSIILSLLAAVVLSGCDKGEDEYAYICENIPQEYWTELAARSALEDMKYLSGYFHDYYVRQSQAYENKGRQEDEENYRFLYSYGATILYTDHSDKRRAVLSKYSNRYSAVSQSLSSDYENAILEVITALLEKFETAQPQNDQSGENADHQENASRMIGLITGTYTSYEDMAEILQIAENSPETDKELAQAFLGTPANMKNTSAEDRSSMLKARALRKIEENPGLAVPHVKSCEYDKKLKQWNLILNGQEDDLQVYVKVSRDEDKNKSYEHAEQPFERALPRKSMAAEEGDGNRRTRDAKALRGRKIDQNMAAEEKREYASVSFHFGEQVVNINNGISGHISDGFESFEVIREIGQFVVIEDAPEGMLSDFYLGIKDRNSVEIVADLGENFPYFAEVNGNKINFFIQDGNDDGVPMRNYDYDRRTNRFVHNSSRDYTPTPEEEELKVAERNKYR